MHQVDPAEKLVGPTAVPLPSSCTTFKAHQRCTSYQPGPAPLENPAPTPHARRPVSPPARLPHASPMPAPPTAATPTPALCTAACRGRRGRSRRRTATRSRSRAPPLWRAARTFSRGRAPHSGWGRAPHDLTPEAARSLGSSSSAAVGAELARPLVHRPTARLAAAIRMRHPAPAVRGHFFTRQRVDLMMAMAVVWCPATASSCRPPLSGQDRARGTPPPPSCRSSQESCSKNNRSNQIDLAMASG
jgi:hypothetical protein